MYIPLVSNKVFLNFYATHRIFFLFRINLATYVAFMVMFSVALVLAVGEADPTTYTSAKDYVRAVLEVASILAILVNLFQEIQSMLQ